MNQKLTDRNIHVGPSDFVPFLNDKKIAYVRIEGRKFGEVPVSVEMRLQVEDSYNSAGVVVDMVRCMKVALNRKLTGTLIEPSAYFCKHPPEQYPDAEAKRMVEEFIGAS